MSLPDRVPFPPRRPAIEAPREVHLHFHGVSAADMASILGHAGQVPGAWNGHPPAAGDG